MRVVLIEDDEVLARMIAEVLRDEQHQVAWAATPEQGLALLAAGTWDLVITDCFSTDYDAPDADEVAHLRSLTAHAPVVLLTGRTWASHCSAAALGVAAILPKPFDLDALLRAVETAAPWLSAGEPPASVAQRPGERVLTPPARRPRRHHPPGDQSSTH